MKKLLLIFFLLSWTKLFSQQLNDTSSLKEVLVKAYFNDQPLLKIPASVSLVSNTILQQQAPFSLVAAANTVAGVRMEERSPGSYRFSIRGSLLRSPFGVRNVKLYFDDFLLTDASGNTYLNLIDPTSISSMEVIKGPEGSIYGANTGGVILIRSEQTGDSLQVNEAITTGSYGTLQQNLSFNTHKEKFSVAIHEGYLSSEGYRQQSKSERKYIHISPQLAYSASGKLKSLFLFSDLNYQTPGGLTIAQFQSAPDSARKQAITQKAEVRNKTWLAGVSNEISLSRHIKHVVSFTASQTGFENPAIANYELRDESSLGLRTYFEYRVADFNVPFTLQAGLESQQTKMQKENFVNDAGSKGEQQQGANLEANQRFAFLHLSASPSKKLVIETAASLNRFNYTYEPIFPGGGSELQRKFENELMPRAAVAYQPFKQLSIRASVSRGFSPPSLEEVNPSGSSINTSIQAEKGWSREMGLRFSGSRNRVYWDAVYFNYHLKDAIVRGVNPNETDYYINAGSTHQKGFESELTVNLIGWSRNKFLRSLQLKNSSTLYRFRFGDYVYNRNGLKNYSGNKLTGVPDKTIITSLNIGLPYNTSLFVQHNFTSEIPLNDANTIAANSYHLLNARASWRSSNRKIPFGAYAGINNLLNEKYSLGNDLNAAADRFFNAAPERNFYIGLTFRY